MAPAVLRRRRKVEVRKSPGLDGMGSTHTVACVELPFQAPQACVREDDAFQSLLSTQTARVQLEFQCNAGIHAYESATLVRILAEKLYRRSQN